MEYEAGVVLQNVFYPEETIRILVCDVLSMKYQVEDCVSNDRNRYWMSSSDISLHYTVSKKHIRSEKLNEILKKDTNGV